MEIQLCGWNTSLQPVGTRAECSENWCSMRKHQHYFWNQMLSVFNSQWNCLPLHFLCASQLSNKDNVVDVREEKTVILARKLGRRNDRTSRCSPVHCHLSGFLHGMNATFSAWALSNDGGSFRWVITASLLVRKMQNPERNSSVWISHVLRLHSPEKLTRKPRFRALFYSYRCTVGSTVITAIQSLQLKI